MDLEQVEKRVEWLDDERRKDKDTITALEDRISNLEGRLSVAIGENKELSGEITRLSLVTGRMDNFDGSLAQHRLEFNQLIDNQGKEVSGRIDELSKVLRAEIKGVDNSLTEVRKGLDPIPVLGQGLNARVEEEQRLNRLIDEVRNEIDDLQRSEEEQTRIYRLIDDGRRQDTKRLTDITGDVQAIRKRSDEYRGRIELIDANLRKVETRLTELMNVESDRREAQSIFLEKQSLVEVERERIWKDYQARFEMVEKQSSDVESQLQVLDATHGSIKRTNTVVDGLVDRVERRLNEIVEMQRLAEERFRQEWVTFKADDQKRWTNYTLSQDEQRSDINRRFDQMSKRVTILEDSQQEIQDMFTQLNDLTEKRLQSLLANAHEWVNAFEKTQGRSR
jgi:chromosome segregation ATPase